MIIKGQLEHELKTGHLIEFLDYLGDRGERLLSEQQMMLVKRVFADFIIQRRQERRRLAESN